MTYLSDYSCNGWSKFLIKSSLPKKREREISSFLSVSLSLSLSLSEKEISLFQTLQVLLDNGVLGNKSDTNTFVLLPKEYHLRDF